MDDLPPIRHSDATGERFFHIICPLLGGIIGFIIAISTMNTAARYISLYVKLSCWFGGVHWSYAASWWRSRMQDLSLFTLGKAIPFLAPHQSVRLLWRSLTLSLNLATSPDRTCGQQGGDQRIAIPTEFALRAVVYQLSCAIFFACILLARTRSWTRGREIKSRKVFDICFSYIVFDAEGSSCVSPFSVFKCVNYATCVFSQPVRRCLWFLSFYLEGEVCRSVAVYGTIRCVSKYGAHRTGAFRNRIRIYYANVRPVADPRKRILIAQSSRIYLQCLPSFLCSHSTRPQRGKGIDHRWLDGRRFRLIPPGDFEGKKWRWATLSFLPPLR